MKVLGSEAGTILHISREKCLFACVHTCILGPAPTHYQYMFRVISRALDSYVEILSALLMSAGNTQRISNLYPSQVLRMSTLGGPPPPPYKNEIPGL